MTIRNSRIRLITKCLLIATMWTAVISTPVPAAEQQPSYDEIRQAFVRLGGSRFDLGRLAQQLAGIYQTLDHGHDGLTTQDIAIYREIEMAKRRAAAVARGLGYDLDGDLVVTRAEVERHMGYSVHYVDQPRPGDQDALDSAVVKRVDKFMAADRNGDGKIELQEFAIEAGVERIPSTNRPSAVDVGELLLKFDPDHDGKLTQIEAFGVLATAFDGFIPESAVPGPTSNASNPKCEPMPVDGGSRVVLLSVFVGRSLSSVALAGQNRLTSAVIVRVEPGDEPLTAILTSRDRVLWRFEGATDRIAKVIVTSTTLEQPGAHVVSGVAGISLEKVSFLKGQNCLPYFTNMDSIKAQMTATMARILLGKAPNVVVGSNGMNTVQLPSGKELVPEKAERATYLTVQKPNGMWVTIGTDGVVRVVTGSQAPANTLPMLQDDYLNQFPGGVVQIDPKSVVADGPAEAYEVLPGKAGLAQLLKQGVLQPWSKELIPDRRQDALSRSPEQDQVLSQQGRSCARRRPRFRVRVFRANRILHSRPDLQMSTPVK